MKKIRFIILFCLIACLVSCVTASTIDTLYYNISVQDILYEPVEKTYYPSPSLRIKIGSAISHAFSWYNAGYVYKDNIQGCGAIVFEYSTQKKQIINKQLIMPSNVKQVDRELMDCLNKIRLTDSIKNSQVKSIKFIFKVEYSTMRIQ